MANRLSKIYTRTGDQGKTGLADGSRVDKFHARIESLGNIDELNSIIGILLTEKLPNEPGHYAVIKNNDTITHISYNYNRKESLLAYYNLSDIKGCIINNSLPITLKNINSESNVTWLWKWFIIFALTLLAFEMLILKYFK